MARIYLVDDHTIVRQALRALLELSGHEVVGEAVAPAPALEGIRATRPEVVLLDLQLDGHSGFEVLAELHRAGDASHTIVLTMSLHGRDVAEAARLGACSYLRKDAPREELLAAIDKARLGEPYASAATEAATTDTDTLPREDMLAALSPRERQIIAMVVKGRSSASIGEQLGLSRKTIDTYRSRLMVKLDVPDVIALVKLAVRGGLADDDDLPG